MRAHLVWWPSCWEQQKPSTDLGGATSWGCLVFEDPKLLRELVFNRNAVCSSHGFCWMNWAIYKSPFFPPWLFQEIWRVQSSMSVDQATFWGTCIMNLRPAFLSSVQWKLLDGLVSWMDWLFFLNVWTAYVFLDMYRQQKSKYYYMHIWKSDVRRTLNPLNFQIFTDFEVDICLNSVDRSATGAGWYQVFLPDFWGA